jgi:hypothetical protein
MRPESEEVRALQGHGPRLEGRPVDNESEIIVEPNVTRSWQAAPSPPVLRLPSGLTTSSDPRHQRRPTVNRHA